MCVLHVHLNSPRDRFTHLPHSKATESSTSSKKELLRAEHRLLPSYCTLRWIARFHGPPNQANSKTRATKHANGMPMTRPDRKVSSSSNCLLTGCHTSHLLRPCQL